MRKQLEFIQAVRGMAAVLVVYFHTGHSPQFGSFGVDVFFVLSGVVMGMLMKDGPTGPVFFTRRITRVVPLYFIATTAAYIVSVLLPGVRASGNLPTFVDYLKSILFIPFKAQNGEIVPVLGVGWTLNYEMAFYLCCAAACVLFDKNREFGAALLVAMLALAAKLVFPYTTAGQFFSNPILFEFAAGLMLWAMVSRTSYRSRGTAATALIVTATGFMAWGEATGLSVIRDAGEWGRPMLYLMPALLIVGLAFLAEESFGRAPALFRRISVLVGDASYAIYLTHLFVLGALQLLFSMTSHLSISDGLGALLAVLISIVVGIAVYELIEMPIQSRIRNTRGKSA